MKNRKNKSVVILESFNANRTRRLNPKLGLLGFFGFLGFIGGAWTRFVFFGFFGFFYEGKMSNTLMDERFSLCVGNSLIVSKIKADISAKMI